MTTPTGTKPRLPQGLAWSDWWKDANGNPVEGDREMPIDKTTKRVAGWLQLCPVDECATEEWFFEEPAPTRFCPTHGQPLAAIDADGSSPDPVGSARQRLAAHVKKVLAARRDRTVDALRAKAVELRSSAVGAAKAASKEGAKHKPSLAISGGLLGGGLVAAALAPEWSMVGGGAIATTGAVVAYGGAYWWKSRQEGGDLVGRAARRAREFARHVGAASVAFGAWLVQAGALGVDVTTFGGRCALAYETLSGCALTWAVNRSRWEFLWAERRRLAQLAREAAERAAREAEAEAARLESLPLAPVGVAVEETPEAVGLAMAARWKEIARASTVPPGFAMAKTWIVPAETREVSAPLDGTPQPIGWEFAVQSEPGALVSRMGGAQPPIVAAREWLAAMLERDPSTVAVVDRPDGKVNRALLILTDGAPLGGAVTWKGPAGIRRGADGAIYGHAGRTIKGDDVEKALWVPGQPGGGGRYGHTGGGKSVMTRLSLLNDLAGGIFSTLYDPKNFVDFSEFVGVIPMGCTREHRDVLLRSLFAEMVRRQQHLTQLSGVDRHGRQRPIEGAWVADRDGPPIRSIWEEFHMDSKDDQYIAWLTTLVRLQRATASMVEVATQGGGLADLGDSVLRGLLNSTCMELFRMPDSQARLAGYSGAFLVSQLPRIPGTLLMVAGDGMQEIPMRGAFVTREDVDGSVFDWLFAPDMTPILQSPTLPEETLDVFEREGLMDLWRLGQGPNGITNLLGSMPEPFAGPASVGVAAAAAPTGGRMAAADVVLAIVMSNPGCNRQFIDTHEAWLSAAGWEKLPDPSAISRAAGKLEKAGLLSRNRNAGTDYRVLASGEARATAALSALLAPHAPPRGEPLTPAQVEADAERAAEVREEERAG